MSPDLKGLSESLPFGPAARWNDGPANRQRLHLQRRRQWRSESKAGREEEELEEEEEEGLTD